MNHLNINIDNYIFGILSGNELKEFENKLRKEPDLISIVEDRESEIIESYLKGVLAIELEQKVKDKIKSDKSFEGKVLFEKSLLDAAKKIKRRKEYESEIEKIKQKIKQEKETGTYVPIKEKRKTKTLVLFRKEVDVRTVRKLFFYSISVAAIFAISIMVFNPFSDQKRIDSYLTEYKSIDSNSSTFNRVPIVELPIFNGSYRTLDSTGTLNIIDEFFIINIKDENLKEKYFIKDKTLYSYFESTNKLKIFLRISVEGQAEYYLCNGNAMFKFSDKIENKILKFDRVEDLDLIKQCE